MAQRPRRSLPALQHGSSPKVFIQSRRFISTSCRQREVCVQWRIREAADLHPGMIVRRVVDELAVADVHAGVRDLLGRLTEEKQITSLKFVAFHRHDACHAACKSASRGITMPRLRTSICVKPEQSNPKLEVPPHK